MSNWKQHTKLEKNEATQRMKNTELNSVIGLRKVDKLATSVQLDGDRYQRSNSAVLDRPSGGPGSHPL
jgi:hypothetical protein